MAAFTVAPNIVFEDQYGKAQGRVTGTKILQDVLPTLLIQDLGLIPHSSPGMAIAFPRRP